MKKITQKELQNIKSQVERLDELIEGVRADHVYNNIDLAVRDLILLHDYEMVKLKNYIDFLMDNENTISNINRECIKS